MEHGKFVLIALVDFLYLDDGKTIFNHPILFCFHQGVVDDLSQLIVFIYHKCGWQIHGRVTLQVNLTLARLFSSGGSL